MQNGKWDDDGPGWAENPDVKAALNPLGKEDGANPLLASVFLVAYSFSFRPLGVCMLTCCWLFVHLLLSCLVTPLLNIVSLLV